ncbi:hypothetical protein FRB91_011715 [Serendipita sp. 411]|nr:hypothetical protein FRC15_008105 [Serendipita sp. 397]KAG8814393.1 hypothetical protein FRC18_001979 [Serendipita sp. 400]KAG8820375.1 hypothetical protein FRC19_008926 [Serendipita sp. 401]KAG8847510.1 hypothetical protein FRB91_011715 [Serendipita sp. 411]KAG9048501.1 hypothetical protein FS842_000389 [Serendipita sp. 407]
MDQPILNVPNNPQEIPENSESTRINEDVRIAAAALEDMRSTPARPAAQSASDIEPVVSRLPSVLNSAMNLYGYSKANSRIVSYGAEMVESGVQALSKPVLDRLPVRVLNYGKSEPTPVAPSPVTPSRDDPLSMQVDGSERGSSSSEAAREEKRQRAVLWTHEQREARRVDSGRNSVSSERHAREAVPSHIGTEQDEDNHMDLSSYDRPLPSTSRPPQLPEESRQAPNPPEEPEPTSSQAITRRGWHTLMIEAGGISAAVSDESMRKLKYCLEWLQWATANLDTQITLLETFISSINATVTGEPVPPSATVSPEALQHYMNVKRNVVNTIRQVVEVVGKYAGGSLPEPAKQRVKGFILSLPGRWSSAVKESGFGDGIPVSSAGESGADIANTPGRVSSSATIPRKRNRLESSTQSLASEATTGSSATIVGSVSAGPSSTNLASSPRPAPPGATRQQLLPPTAGAARHAAHRVLTLAQESLHAVKGVTSVFKDTLDRADTWVDRLRRVGYNRYQEDSDQGSSSNTASSQMLRPPHRGPPRSPSVSLSSVSSLQSSTQMRRLQMTPRELHLEALARSMPSVGPYGPYDGSGTTPPMSPVLGPHSNGTRKNAFPFDNPAPGAPGYGWVGDRRKSDSGLSAVPTLNLSERQSGRSRAGSVSQYESSTGESLPPPSVIGSTSSVAGDDELDEDGDIDQRRVRVITHETTMDEDEDGLEHRLRKRRRKEDETG